LLASFVADGRFHLESLMIHNPHVSSFYKYDPYSKKLTRESYSYSEMYELRQAAIEKAKPARKWGLILGTLGRQGNINILQRLEYLLKSQGKEYVILLLSEIFPDKLAKLREVEA
jgi:2-(3-amino-3-carboxypropyl)histidine synthase